jgi:hypothetical protein
MQGQQHVLHEVVSIGCLQEPKPSPQQGHDFAQETRVGSPVASLSGAHQSREFSVLGFAFNLR